MTSLKIKAILSAIRSQPQAEITQAQIPILPNEILELILKILQEKGEFKILTSVARVNKNMYDIAIPKIYQTVIVNKRNRSKIGYGHGTSTSNLELATNDEPLTRKDFATTFTRKLVFDFEPETAIPKSYRAVEEVVFGSACMNIACYLSGDQIQKVIQAKRVASLFAKSLAAIASTESSAIVLHVKMHMPRRMNYDILRDQLRHFGSSIPIIYEFFDVPINWVNNVLILAYEMQAVVHFVQNGDVSPDVLAQDFADLIVRILIGDVSVLANVVYLCDVPHLVLRPGEIDSSDDVNNSAMVKICSCIDDYLWPDQVTTPTKRLEFLKSRVKLVQAGFRPTLSQMVTTQHPGKVPTPRHRSTNSS